MPDGVAFDSDGRLYIAVYTPSIIYRLEPDGRLVTLYEEWERFMLDSATNVAFAGPDLKTLLVANLDGRKLLRASVEVAGSTALLSAAAGLKAQPAADSSKSSMMMPLGSRI